MMNDVDAQWPHCLFFLSIFSFFVTNHLWKVKGETEKKHRHTLIFICLESTLDSSSGYQKLMGALGIS